MKNAQTIGLILLAAVIAAVGVMGNMTAQKWVKQQAIDSCLKTSSYTSEVGGTEGRNSSVEPMKNWYEFCMKEKGLK
ncbi:hypothetical protein HY612_03035 [Candidatus Roizmanbacteria bacterium]|nr:hypothetical protein [Candidatus Roizmanbacteria bacterium]